MQREVIPSELLDIFEEAFDHSFPWPASGPEGTDYESFWTYHVAKGISILKCSLRDCYGNEEDFEWELTLRTP